MKRSIALVLALSAAALAAAESPKPALSKDETVYALLDPSGKVESVFVSDWLHSERAGALVHDRSDLTDIENVKGKEVPSRSGKDLSWQLSGQDLYYRGRSTKALPLSVSVSYFLDGAPAKPQALAGKSGRIRVRIEVKNLAAGFAGAGAAGAGAAGDGAAGDGGERRLVHAPLLVVVGLDLPAATFSDIELKGGKLLSDGQNNIVAGLLLPGLLSDLNAGEAAKSLSELGLSALPLGDSFEFSATARNFKLGPIMLAASPDMPKLGKSGAAAKLSGLMADLKRLGEASAQIRSGSAALAAGAGQLHEGIKTASEGLAPLFAKKADFAPALELIGSDEEVAAARELLFELKGLQAAAPALLELSGEALDGKNQAALKKALDDASGLDARALIGSPLLGGLVSEQSLAAMAESMKASDELYRGLDGRKLAAAAELGPKAAALLEAEAGFAEKSAFLDEGERLAALKAKLAAGAPLSAEESSELLGLVEAAAAGRAALASAGAAGPSAIGELAGATAELSAAAPRIAAAKEAYGRNRLSFELARSFLALRAKSGSFKAQLAKLEALQRDLGELEPLLEKCSDLLSSEAAAPLEGLVLDGDKARRLGDDLVLMEPLLGLGDRLLEPESLAELRAASARLPELESGLGQLESGSALLAEKLGELASGAAQFDEEGIKPLVSAGSAAGGLALGLCQRADELSELSLDYRTFSGAPQGAATSLKFVLRTEEIR